MRGLDGVGARARAGDDRREALEGSVDLGGGRGAAEAEVDGGAGVGG